MIVTAEKGMLLESTRTQPKYEKEKEKTRSISIRISTKDPMRKFIYQL
jgi:hypothetical protein